MEKKVVLGMRPELIEVKNERMSQDDIQGGNIYYRASWKRLDC